MTRLKLSFQLARNQCVLKEIYEENPRARANIVQKMVRRPKIGVNLTENQQSCEFQTPFLHFMWPLSF